MPSRDLLFSVTLGDCEVQHFRAGGPGGQNQNKRDTATRIIHHPSGARGESREERSQLQNKKAAFRRMADHPSFRWWVSQEVHRLEGRKSAEQAVEAMLSDERQIKVEVKDSSGRWTEVPYTAPLSELATVSGTTVRVHAKTSGEHRG